MPLMILGGCFHHCMLYNNENNLLLVVMAFERKGRRSRSDWSGQGLTTFCSINWRVRMCTRVLRSTVPWPAVQCMSVHKHMDAVP